MLVRVGGEEQVFVPVRPLCDYLGADRLAQFRRLSRDAVLSDVQETVAITAVDGRVREQVCLPVDCLNGWLFGVNAERVNPEIRDSTDTPRLSQQTHINFEAADSPSREAMRPLYTPKAA